MILEGQTKNEETNFLELLDDYNYERPQRGDFIQGIVLKVDLPYAVHVDIGGKTDAVVTQEELDCTPQPMLADLNEGDVLSVFVVKGPGPTHKPEVSIRKGLEREDWVHAQEDLDQKNNLTLKITDANKGGLLVAYRRLQGFVPNSLVPELGHGGSRDRLREIKASMVGDEIPAQIIEVEAQHQRLILSVRAAEEAMMDKRLHELELGGRITGRVVNIVEYGVFVNLNGIDGLAHISELDHKHVAHPSEICAVGDEMLVEVIDIDIERERVGLSRKRTLPLPEADLQSLQDNFSF
jgi:small subunit ribosomal protein S1